MSTTFYRMYRKWDYDKHEYKPYLVPADKKLSTFEEDMNTIVNCCQCLKELPMGEAYTSLEVHTGTGFGYAVCDKCYEKEFKRKEDNEKV